MIDRKLPDTAAEAFQELSDIVGELAGMAGPMGLEKSFALSGRAGFLIGSLEMSAEMGGTWKGTVQEGPLKRGNAMKRLDDLLEELKT